jgi:hypothetical protein
MDSEHLENCSTALIKKNTQKWKCSALYFSPPSKNKDTFNICKSSVTWALSMWFSAVIAGTFVLWSRRMKVMDYRFIEQKDCTKSHVACGSLGWEFYRVFFPGWREDYHVLIPLAHSNCPLSMIFCQSLIGPEVQSLVQQYQGAFTPCLFFLWANDSFHESPFFNLPSKALPPSF